MTNHAISTRLQKFWKSLAFLSLLVLTACSGSTGQTGISPAQITGVAATSSVTASLSQSTMATGAGSELTASTATVNLPQTGGTQVSTQPALVCSSPASLTPSMTEGPYYKPGSPERSSLLSQGVSGTKLVLSGYVLTTGCKPVAHALLDFWQANAQGQYDNQGYTLRGHLFTEQTGYYQLVTIVPGLYPGRTEHIHVKVQAPNGPILTTQLFFPGVPQNQSDQIFDQRLLMAIQNTNNGMQATYNFVVNIQ